MASLLGRLGIKAAEALPGIIGRIISWIPNRAKDVIGWVSQNLFDLVVGIVGLIYMYLLTRNSYFTNHNIINQSNTKLPQFQSCLEQ